MTHLEHGRAQPRDNQIRVYGSDAFEGMRKAGQLAAEALDMLTEHVVPGVTTEHLDELVYDFARSHNAIPAPLNYRGFPKSICTSINHVVCHGIPGPKPLREGDILNIDVTLIVDGWHGDTSRMYGVGAISRRANRLIDVTYESLMRGIAVVKPGATTGDIGVAIETYARAERCSVVEDFCGHGLGQVFHDRPNILHYRSNHKGHDVGPGVELRPGMLFTIEPMINLGKPHVKILADGWTAVTRDRELSAQFEHTIGVTDTGCEVFTHSPRGIDRPPTTVS
jgi:methionyl aminopeptidase